MPATHTQLHYHLVFGTKNRVPAIDPGWENPLHAYLGGCLRRIGCTPLEIGGYAEHVHILTGMKANHKVCEVVGDIKSASSRWVHDQCRMPGFEWQEGYGAFTASTSALAGLRGYIQRQKEHHRVCTFLEEYVALLEEAGIEWDPRYLP